ncbi:hypothetical protein CLOP_g11694 [Closterium sp. NIES-67]|nr:hypothetical protein CLOP_g11694 [Closterium sp. NIES-67]
MGGLEAALTLVGAVADEILTRGEAAGAVGTTATPASSTAPPATSTTRSSRRSTATASTTSSFCLGSMSRWRRLAEKLRFSFQNPCGYIGGVGWEAGVDLIERHATGLIHGCEAVEEAANDEGVGKGRATIGKAFGSGEEAAREGEGVGAGVRLMSRKARWSARRELVSWRS